MSLNLILIQLVVFTCAVMLVRAHRLARGWLVVAGVILATLALCLVAVPGWAGFISGGVWTILLFLPILGFNRVGRLVTQECYQQARKWANLVKWLHPADGYWEYPQLLRGLELGQQGRFDDAKQLFHRYCSDRTSTGRTATAMLYRMEARWADLVHWLEHSVGQKVLQRELGLTITYLRALGEVGELNRLLQGVEQAEQTLGRGGNADLLNLTRLYGLAFCGQVEQVEQLLKKSLKNYSHTTREFWLAVAEMAAGETTIAQTRFTALRQTSDYSLQRAIDWRLAAPTLNLEQTLTHASYQVLVRLRTAIGQEARYSSRLAIAARNSYATYALIGINFLVFGLSTRLGGIDDPDVLERLGALDPKLVVAGEWWRCLTATFLHAGWLHISANMLGLYVFGALVESALGKRKFLFCYFFCGIGSMLTVAIVAVLTQSVDQVTVGASGAVLGMVGAEAAIQLKGWWLEKAAIARERFRLIILVVGFQILSDLVTPQVSMLGHLSGVTLGFLAGLILFKANHRQ